MFVVGCQVAHCLDFVLPAFCLFLEKIAEEVVELLYFWVLLVVDFFNFFCFSFAFFQFSKKLLNLFV